MEKDEVLFDKRESVELTPDNATFFRSAGGLVSLTLKHEDGADETFERIVPVRAFPVTEPDEFIAIREPDVHGGGDGEEIGMIRRLADFDETTVKLLCDELERRYFAPVITKINGVKEKFGYIYFDAETSAGKVSFVMNNPTSNVRTLEDDRTRLYDVDGNCFEIPEIAKLDKASLHKIELYL